MKPKTFEDYMQEIHMELFPSLLDDDISDHFDDWLGTLDGEDYMKYGEEAVHKAYLAGMDRVLEGQKPIK